MTVRFAILMPWGRVGSNLLMAILREAHSIKLNSEKFNQLATAEAQRIWFEEFYEVSSSKPQHRHIGSKQNMLAVRDTSAFEDLCKKHELKIVRLRRDNCIKAAVSQIRAEKFAEKSKKETGVAQWALKKGHPPLGAITIDPELLCKRAKIMETQQDILLNAFQECEFLDIEYEQINSSLKEVVSRLRDFLDIEQKGFSVPFDKATPDDLRQAIANYDQIVSYLADTSYAAQLR